MKAKSSTSRKGTKIKDLGGSICTTFQDRDLKAVNPKTNQFEPTAAEPVRQHFKMAGGT